MDIPFIPEDNDTAVTSDWDGSCSITSIDIKDRKLFSE